MKKGYNILTDENIKHYELILKQGKEFFWSNLVKQSNDLVRRIDSSNNVKPLLFECFFKSLEKHIDFFAQEFEEADNSFETTGGINPFRNKPMDY